MTGTLKTAYIQNPSASDRNISVFANNNTAFANNITVANNVTVSGNITVTGTITGNITSALSNVTVTNPTLSGTTTANNLVVSGAAYQAIDSLTDNTTIQIDMSLGNNFNVTLGGNRTLGTPTNLNPGQSGIIYVSQDATGSRTLAYASCWRFPLATAPTLSTTANTVDALAYSVRTTSNIAVQFIQNIG